jgi:ketosteroid isomerase-like protein
MSAQQMAKMKTDSARGEIEKLHQQDVAATVSSSVSGLVALWSDDGVLISQGDSPLVGKAAIQASLTEKFAKNPTMKVLKYEPEVKNLELVGDIAYEWGCFSVTQQGSATSKSVSFRGRFLRVHRAVHVKAPEKPEANLKASHIVHEPEANTGE